MVGLLCRSGLCGGGTDHMLFAAGDDVCRAGLFEVSGPWLVGEWVEKKSEPVNEADMVTVGSWRRTESGHKTGIAILFVRQWKICGICTNCWRN